MAKAMNLEVHDINHPAPTLCLVLSETAWGSQTCEVVAVFGDSEHGREAARRISDMLGEEDENEE